jgi:hypothetical protein
MDEHSTWATIAAQYVDRDYVRVETHNARRGLVKLGRVDTDVSKNRPVKQPKALSLVDLGISSFPGFGSALQPTEDAVRETLARVLKFDHMCQIRMHDWLLRFCSALANRVES